LASSNRRSGATLDPFPVTEDSLLLPIFKEPKPLQAVLPGDIHYMQVEGIEENLQISEKVKLRKAGKLRQRVLTTGTAKDGNLFRIHFDEFDKG
jgi:hypothetical protein